jgi:hypothetical protein
MNLFLSIFRSLRCFLAQSNKITTNPAKHPMSPPSVPHEALTNAQFAQVWAAREAEATQAEYYRKACKLYDEGRYVESTYMAELNLCDKNVSPLYIIRNLSIIAWGTDNWRQAEVSHC